MALPSTTEPVTETDREAWRRRDLIHHMRNALTVARAAGYLGDHRRRVRALASAATYRAALLGYQAGRRRAISCFVSANPT